MQTVPRLIDQFSPTHYDLSLMLGRAERTFRGTVTIHGVSPDSTGTIIVHAKDLAIESATLDGKEADFGSSDNDELHITHPDIHSGTHILVIGFSGTITDPMHGLYPCYYEYNGVKKELLATQFESHHTREVFPCIDEPEAKATFDVTLTTEQNITVLGNMPVERQVVADDQLVTSFKTSPKMSTYLLAFVVGEMHKKTATTKSGVEVNVWATPAQPPESLDFALGVATRTIDFFDEYFGVPYPLPKSDHVALPDFGSGAMENWGLITYREIALLADPKTTSISSKQYIATVVAHELSHQWFGNLVTMKWWNNLWLNESFATLMEYIAIDALYPEWNIWLDFASGEVVMALRRDSVDGVQAVQVDVNHPDEISTLFDGAIVYAKGARLLRMLEHYVGKEDFRTGLGLYFKEHAYSNTDQDDLWNALAKISGKDIAGLMNTWISQSGYPVLHVSQDGDQVTLAQEQFFVGPHEASSKLWPIPLTSPCSEMPEILSERSVVVTRHHTTPLRFNDQDTAHFITHYSDDLLQRLIGEVSAGNLSMLDRIQLLDESTMLARAGILPSIQLISLLGGYKNETSEPVWTIMSMAIGELKKFVDDNPIAESKLRTFAANMAAEQYARLGWDAKPGESEEDSKLRATILALTLYGEAPDALQKAKTLFESNDLIDLDPELRPLIISSVVRHDDGKIFDALFSTYKSSSSAELQQDICLGITSTRTKEKILLLLEAIKDPLVIRPQDAARWFVYLIRGRESRDAAWQWIRDNWQWVIDTFAGDKSYDDYPRYSASSLVTREQLAQYIEFFTPKKEIPALSRVITIGVSEIEGRVELIERDRDSVISALLAL
ncbi:MAG: M1 family metallopeptidase [Candidatus Saccharimonadales bacterium]